MQRVHGHVSSKSIIVPSMNFFTIYTLNQIDSSSDYQVNGQTDLDVPNPGRNTERFVKVFSQAAVPVIITVSDPVVVDLSDAPTAAFYGFGSDFVLAATTVYAIKFASERPFVWGGSTADVNAGLTTIKCEDPASNGSLANALNTIPLAFTTPMASVPGATAALTSIKTVGTQANTAVKFFNLL